MTAAARLNPVFRPFATQTPLRQETRLADGRRLCSKALLPARRLARHNRPGAIQRRVGAKEFGGYSQGRSSRRFAARTGSNVRARSWLCTGRIGRQAQYLRVRRWRQLLHGNCQAPRGAATVGANFQRARGDLVADFLRTCLRMHEVWWWDE